MARARARARDGVRRMVRRYPSGVRGRGGLPLPDGVGQVDGPGGGLGAERLQEPEAHEMEAPEVVLVPLSSLPELIDTGEIRGGASVAGLLQALRRVR